MFKKRIIAFTLSTLLCVPIGMGIKAIQCRDGVRNIGGEVFLYKDGKLQTGKQTVEGRTYYFAETGEAVTGWQFIEGKPMYFNEESKQAETGVVEIENTKYNFSNEGTVETGWQTDGSYKDEQGFVVKNTVVKEDGVEKLVDQKGSIVSGWKELDGKKVYYKEDGSLAKGETEIGKEKFYFQEDGLFLTGWVVKEIPIEAEEEKVETDEEVVKELLQPVELAEKEDDNSIPVTEEKTDKNTADTPKEEDVSSKQMDDQNKKSEPKVVNKRQYYTKNGYLVKGKLFTIDNKQYAFDQSGYLIEESNKEYLVNEKTKEARLMSEWEKEQEALKQQQLENERIRQENLKKQQENIRKQISQSNSGNDLSADLRAKIASSALAQASVNKQQDCTALATNALASAGIYYHDWPENYACLGRWVSNPEPGDLAIYSGHIAVVSGQGTAVHGGFFNGQQTVNYSISCSQKLIGFIRVQK